MLEACRTCLGLINIDISPFYEIEADDMQLSAESCRSKLLSIVPKMALNITPKSMLCAECHRSLETLFEFKEKCLKTENIIAQYFQTRLDLDIKDFDLKDVSAFSTLDIKISEEESVEVFVEDVALKKEVELSDTAIVKHEIDDFSSESVEVARLKNAPSSLILISAEEPGTGSSADIKISEDGAVEASVEDVTIKEEVKFSDTVITNVKHEVDDFSSESVKLARPKNAVPDSNFMCEYCEKRCKNSSSLKIHLRTHTGEKPHRCEICDRRFLKKHNLTVHLRTHTGERPHICTVCDKGFPSNYELMIHMRGHTGEKPHRCEICDRRFVKKHNLTVHLRTHTGEKPHRCEICDCRFVMKHHLTDHLRTHTGEKAYRCEICDRSFSHKPYLKTHLRTHTGERPYLCTLCGKGFPSKFEFTVHMRSHTGEKPHRCEICDCLFLMKHHLTDHLRTHTGEKPYQCETCDRSFACKTNLTKHQRIHTGERPHICTVCRKGFPTNTKLTVHMRIHTGEEPYRCKTCDRSFTHREQLTTHLRIHSGELPYVCTVCGKGYTSSFNLKKHTRTHNTEQPHQCGKNSSLEIHHKKRSRSKNFQCEHCKELFWHNQQLQRHVRKVHKDVDVNMVFIKCENTSFTDQEETQNSIASLSGQ